MITLLSTHPYVKRFILSLIDEYQRAIDERSSAETLLYRNLNHGLINRIRQDSDLTSHQKTQVKDLVNYYLEKYQALKKGYIGGITPTSDPDKTKQALVMRLNFLTKLSQEQGWL